MPEPFEQVYQQITNSFIDMFKWITPAIIIIVIIAGILRIGQDILADALANLIKKHIPKEGRKVFFILILLGLLFICIGIFYGFDMEIVYHN